MESFVTIELREVNEQNVLCIPERVQARVKCRYDFMFGSTHTVISFIKQINKIQNLRQLNKCFTEMALLCTNSELIKIMTY